jgi:hypothetical protein
VRFSKRGTRREPKFLIFLIDESTSMLESSGAEPKHVVVDRCVNGAIEQLVTICNRADGVRDYAQLAVIGYGGQNRTVPTLRSLLNTRNGAWTASLSEVAATATVVNGRAKYVASAPDGWTPMGAAIRLAGRLVNDWLMEHNDSPAPVIVNITDGMPTDDEAPEGPMEEWAAKLESLRTIDGECLLINVGAPGASGEYVHSCVFPTQDELPPVQGALRLWSSASPLPEELLQRATRLGLVPPGSAAAGRRLYAHGTDVTLLEKIFDFGTEVRAH